MNLIATARGEDARPYSCNPFLRAMADAMTDPTRAGTSGISPGTINKRAERNKNDIYRRGGVPSTIEVCICCCDGRMRCFTVDQLHCLVESVSLDVSKVLFGNIQFVLTCLNIFLRNFCFECA